MPPKQKITKAVLLECAFKIAEDQGIAAVTSRSVSKAAGCSIQPVFSQFPTMEELRKATFDYACDWMVREILSFVDKTDFLLQTTIWVINFAREKPQLYHLIYLSNNFPGNNLLDVILKYESIEKIIDKMMETYKLELEVCKDILLRAFLLLMGIGAMICVNHVDFYDSQVIDMINSTVNDMIQGAKSRTVS